MFMQGQDNKIKPFIAPYPEQHKVKKISIVNWHKREHSIRNKNNKNFRFLLPIESIILDKNLQAKFHLYQFKRSSKPTFKHKKEGKKINLRTRSNKKNYAKYP